MLTIDDVCRYLREIAPLDLAEDWDNVGLLVGTASSTVERVMTCLTVTPTTVAEAISGKANLIVTHHPFPFRSINKITDETTVGCMLLELIAHQVAVYSAHTAFDSASNGINQQLAVALELADIRPLCNPVDTQPSVGTGRTGILPTVETMDDVAARLKTFLGIPHLRAVGECDRAIRRIAIACGSAGQFISQAQQAGCDLLVTGETSFHTCLEAEAQQIGLLLLGHFASERFAMETLADRIAKEQPSVTVWASQNERDPLRLT